MCWVERGIGEPVVSRSLCARHPPLGAEIVLPHLLHDALDDFFLDHEHLALAAVPLAGFVAVRVS